MNIIHFLLYSNKHYWRVTYPDGRRTRLLSYYEAEGLKDCFGGKLWFDKIEKEQH